MRHNKLEIYLHLVWTTWERQPLITSDIERRLYRQLEGEARNCGCVVLSMGGIEDHVHLLVEMPPTICISNLVKQLKGVFSLFVNEELQPPSHFKWRGSYAAFTVSRWDVSKIKKYIAQQKEHHQRGSSKSQLEPDLNEIDDLPSN